jgi:hypothetical protein
MQISSINEADEDEESVSGAAISKYFDGCNYFD